MKFVNRLQPPPQLPQQQQQPNHDEVNNNLNESKFESFLTGTNNNNNNNSSKSQLSTDPIQLPKKSQPDVDGLDDDDNVAVYELNPAFKIEVRDPVRFFSLSGFSYPVLVIRF